MTSTQLHKQARNDVVERYTPLAKHHARRFAGRGEPIEDLTQVATLALINAVDRFDAGRGVNFASYATPTIVGALKRHFRDHTWAIRVPRALKERGLLVRDSVAEACQDLGRSPTVSELAERAELSIEDVVEAMDVGNARSPGWLDDQSDPNVDWLREREDWFEIVDDWAPVAPLLRRLPERERAILYYRFGREMTQSEIAAQLGLSQMHVSRLLSRALRWLRAEADEARG